MNKNKNNYKWLARKMNLAGTWNRNRIRSNNNTNNNNNNNMKWVKILIRTEQNNDWHWVRDNNNNLK